MDGKLAPEALSRLAEAGVVDTVLACCVDGHGALRGRRLHVRRFLEMAQSEFRGAGLEAGDAEAAEFGAGGADGTTGAAEAVLSPDLATLRRAAWLPGAALVLCRLRRGGGTGAFLPHDPRHVLARQVARMREAGLAATATGEVEFVVLECSPAQARAGRLGSTPISGIGRDAPDPDAATEALMRRLRNDLHDSGVAVDGTAGGGTGHGRRRLALGSCPASEAADSLAIVRQAARDIGAEAGQAVSFHPRLPGDDAGSAMSVRLALWNGRDPAFFDASLPLGLSRLARAFLAGMIRGIDDCMAFLAPTVNAQKRLGPAGPPAFRKAWSVDDPGAAFRLRGAGTAAICIECRVPGADANAGLVIAALLAAGLDGIAQHLDCGDPVRGGGDPFGGVPILSSLREAALALHGSATLRAAMGDAVVEHYAAAARAEQAAFDAAVTDWEIARGFALG